MNTPSPEQWVVIVPLKPFRIAKSRLQLNDHDRHALARAMATDTLHAVDACPLVSEIIVVTHDITNISATLPVDARLVAEGPPAGIDAAIRTALGTLPADCRRAALVGDLPFLSPDDLAEALSLAAYRPHCVVPDKDRTGSTLVTAAPGVPLTTRFGPQSFTRHLDLGCEALTVRTGSTLRWDVDTIDDLTPPAIAPGPRTQRLLSRIRLVPPQTPHPATTAWQPTLGELHAR